MKRGLDLERTALKRRRTKIVATLGPASSSDDVIGRLIAAGVDVFRLNFSHGNHEGHAANLERVRRLAEGVGRHVAVLADLSGPKIRVGTFEGGAVELVTDSVVRVTTKAGVVGKAGLIPSQYAALAQDARPGDRVLLDDGKLELRVEALLNESELDCRVVVGGRLSDNKGMNLPGVAVSAPSLTQKDRDDAVFAASLSVDYMALSFVRSGEDVLGLRRLLVENGSSAHIVAKIEKPEALVDIEAILDASDAIMVARGDLGVEMPPEEVPVVQQELVRRAAAHQRPVIVATQMLESMIDNPRPTRAEVTDVAFAAMGKADAVMLSAETASGRFPIDAVATMDRVLRLVEGHQWRRGEHGVVDVRRATPGEALEVHEALSRATSLLSSDLAVRAIVVPTRSGRMARVVASERPAAPILALTSDAATCRRLALSWGLTPVLVSDEELRDPGSTGARLVLKLELAAAGQTALLIWDANSSDGPPRPTVSVLLV